MFKVYFSLGSNVGNRQKFLQGALDLIKEKIRLLEVSSVYETEPWGHKDQAYFLNQCASGETDLEPLEVLEFIKNIELKLGRVHTEKWGPREIDIDLLFYDDRILESEALRIPHPYIAERAFVLIPLSEIAPTFLHPVLKKSVAQLSEELDESGIKKYE